MNARMPALALAGLVLFPGTAAAQVPRYEMPQKALGMSFIVGAPLEHFSDFVGAGYGAEFSGRLQLEPQGIVSLRADMGFLIYGYDSRTVAGCGCDTKVYTSNGIFFGGIGPELAVPLDWARPYLNAFVGFGYFSTSSSEGSGWWDEDPVYTEYLGDGTFSWGFGGGIEVNLRQGPTPLFLNLGARYHQNGIMKYLTEGDIQDNPDGSVTVFPVVSEANLISFRIGLTVGFPGGRGDEGIRD